MSTFEKFALGMVIGPLIFPFVLRAYVWLLDNI